MKALVTGAAGFIGSHLCSRLLQEGHSVTGLDNLDDFYDPLVKRENVSALETVGDWHFVVGDIRDADLLDRTLPGHDAVFHLAARVGVRPSFDQVKLYQDVNVRGTAGLLEVAARSRIPRFIFGSSSSVYGEGAPTPFHEQQALGVPQSPYARTKIAGELICHHFRERFESVLALRFFTVYGPRQRPDLAIHRFARLISDREQIPVFGDLESFRDYTYVDDIVDGVLAALMVETPWAVVNLGGGNPVTLGRLIEELEGALGRRAERNQLPHQKGDLLGTWADIGEAKRLLGYSPRWAFKDGIRAFVEWFRGASQRDSSPKLRT